VNYKAILSYAYPAAVQRERERELMTQAYLEDNNLA
jgi:hypothetical protein